MPKIDKDPPAEVDCPTCDGDGSLEKRCTRCRNYGGRHCGACGDSGFVGMGKCTRCKGTGKILDEDLEEHEREDPEDEE